jgi:UDP-N-acetylmuramate dehydrogenase
MTKSIDFSKFSSFKIGSKVDVKLLQKCSDFHQDDYIIGSCNNILISNNPPPLIKLSKRFNYITLQNNILKIGGATPSGKIASFCKKNNIANFEFLSHLPGTLGGLVKMNAGLKEYEIFNHLISVDICGDTKLKNEINFGYRYTDIKKPILEATFEVSYGFDDEKVLMFKKMRANQPHKPSAGSCFKNPHADYAGRLIEEVGLKGFRVGDMEFSKVHANFLINHGNGCFEDAMYLINEAKKRVLEKFSIQLELEIEVLDDKKTKNI